MKLIAALIVTLPMLAQTARSAPHTVTAVRHYRTGEVTRVAIEVSGDFNYVTERLHNPERVYYDITDSRPRVNGRRAYIETVEERLLKRIRVAETLPGVTRIVLELGNGVEVTASQLNNPARLIIELRHELKLEPPSALITAAPAPHVEPQTPAVAAPSSAPPNPASAPPVPTSVLEKSALGQPSAARPAKSKNAAGTSRTKPSAPSPLPEPAVKIPPPSVSDLAILGKTAAPDFAAPPKPAVPEAAPRSAKPAVSDAAAATALSEIGKAARHTSGGETSLVRALGLKINRVVIDPGHGGHDQGTQGAKGLLEKDLVLDVARRVGKLIGDRLGAEVIYTRTDDTFVPLEGRTALANEKQADLFLSIHANSSPISKTVGVETYYLNFTEAKDALDVAARENASSQKSVFELRDLIQKITLHTKSEESKEFAARIQTSLFAFSARNFPGTRNRGVKKAPFVVLIGANMPSVLAEIGFLSNPREEQLLKRSEYRDKLAEAIFRGIQRYADGLSHFQVARAQGN